MGFQGANNDLTIIILSGGKSSRMGRDKGLLATFKGAFIEDLVQMASRITSNVIISVSKETKRKYEYLNLPLIVDELENVGPLGGICASIKKVKTNWFLLLAVDSPLVTRTIVKSLWRNREKFEAVVFGNTHQIHPLVGLYSISTKNQWLKALGQNRLKITDIINSFNLKVLNPNERQEKELNNINTPEQYAQVFDS